MTDKNCHCNDKPKSKKYPKLGIFDQVLAKNYGIRKNDAQTIYVDAKHGNDKCNNGTIKSPLKTVNAAILLAAGNGLTDISIA